MNKCLCSVIQKSDVYYVLEHFLCSYMSVTVRLAVSGTLKIETFDHRFFQFKAITLVLSFKVNTSSMSS